MNDETKAKLVIVGEILFILLPLLIVNIFLVFKEKSVEIFIKSDWTFAAIIFFGQCIVKLISGLIKSEKKFRWQNVGLIIASLIVVGLIPATVILVLLLMSTQITLKLIVCQLIWFVLSIVTYYYLGTIGQMYLDKQGKD